MEPAVYQELVDSYPDKELFAYIPKLGKKYSLSERFNPKQYREFIRNSQPWKELHQWIKSDQFIIGVLDALKAQHIELGYDPSMSQGKRLKRLLTNFSRKRSQGNSARLKARFEFSMLPADGGHILPHTDAPAKIITLIVSMLNEGEWNPAFGGGTDVNRPKRVEDYFNRINRQAQFEDMGEIIDTYEFTPNQAVIFIKTFNSWHSVRPMQGHGSSAMRKTLTINIESHL